MYSAFALANSITTYAKDNRYKLKKKHIELFMFLVYTEYLLMTKQRLIDDHFVIEDNKPRLPCIHHKLNIADEDELILIVINGQTSDTLLTPTIPKDDREAHGIIYRTFYGFSKYLR